MKNRIEEYDEYLRTLLHESEAQAHLYAVYAHENKKNWLIERSRRIAYQCALISVCALGLLVVLAHTFLI